MTRSLFILRHGKSALDAPGGSDHDRPLKPRGERSAALIGRFLTSTGQEPDVVLCSSAVRAHTTAEIAREAGRWQAACDVRSELYLCSVQAIVDAIFGIDHDAERVLVVGHEPTCSATVAAFTNGPAPHFPTAALARLDFEIDDWSEATPGSASLGLLVLPRHLEALIEDAQG